MDSISPEALKYTDTRCKNWHLIAHVLQLRIASRRPQIGVTKACFYQKMLLPKTSDRLARGHAFG